MTDMARIGLVPLVRKQSVRVVFLFNRKGSVDFRVSLRELLFGVVPLVGQVKSSAVFERKVDDFLCERSLSVDTLSGTSVSTKSSAIAERSLYQTCVTAS